MSSPATSGKLGSGDRPFGQHRVAEAEQLGRTAAGVGRRSRRFPRPVPAARSGGGSSACARSRPASASTLRCSCSRVKVGGISSNTTGRYLILARSRAMPVARMRRWSTGHRLGRVSTARRRAVAHRFRHQPGFVQQLVALQHQFLVPAVIVEAERDRGPLPALPLRAAPAADFAQARNARRQRLLDQRRRARAMILPREIVVPARPAGLRASRACSSRVRPR